MKIKSLYITSITALIALTSCSSTSAPAPKKYNIDRNKNISSIERSFELYKKNGPHKAMAVALDAEGKYVLGYSFDCASEESAKNIALNHCNSANARAEVKADAPCRIFAVENTIVKPLQ